MKCPEAASFQQSKPLRNDSADSQCLVVTGAKGMSSVRGPQGNPQPSHGWVRAAQLQHPRGISFVRKE